jgi:hypothetical protein
MRGSHRMSASMVSGMVMRAWSVIGIDMVGGLGHAPCPSYWLGHGGGRDVAGWGTGRAWHHAPGTREREAGVRGAPGTTWRAARSPPCSASCSGPCCPGPGLCSPPPLRPMCCRRRYPRRPVSRRPRRGPRRRRRHHRRPWPRLSRREHGLHAACIKLRLKHRVAAPAAC